MGTTRFYRISGTDQYIKSWPLMRLMLGTTQYILAVATSPERADSVTLEWLVVPRDLERIEPVRASELPPTVRRTFAKVQAGDVIEALVQVGEALWGEILDDDGDGWVC